MRIAPQTKAPSERRPGGKELVARTAICARTADLPKWNSAISKQAQIVHVSTH